ncbi:MAG: AEC family transporter [Gammaproteobacteria bacterium]|nr:AEC family transporter [Gammaproteobacteria bacterium]
MVQIIVSIAPVFLLIVLGHALRRGGIPSVEFWNLNDRLVYWVLFPALLFYKTSTISFAGGVVGPYAVAIYGALACAIGFALLCARLGGLNGATAASLLQGCARHNTFIALAVSERLFGGEGLAIAALTTALLIPVTNVSMVSLIVTLVRERGSSGLGRAIVRDLSRNPLLIAVLLGVAMNLSGSGPLPVIHDMCQILGNAALPVVLLCVGANIRVKEMAAGVLPLSLSMLGKLLIFPLAMWLLARQLELPAAVVQVAMIYAAVPVAPGAYTLSRQLGGDAPLMAGMITVQTALSFLTLPFTLMLVQRLA